MARLQSALKNEKKIQEIHPRYQHYFTISQRRVTSKDRHIALIRPESLSAFMKTLSQDSEIQVDLKVLVVLLLSGGLRISEAIMLQRSDFVISDCGKNVRYFNRVLKKRGQKLEKENTVHPEALDIIVAYLKTLRGFDKCFNFSRKAALHRLKSYFGEPVDLHALRHSFISFLMFEKKMGAPVAGKVAEISQSMIDRYSHVNKSEIISTLFEKSEEDGP